MNMFDKLKSARDKGALRYLRNNLGHFNVSTNVNNCFDHCYEMVEEIGGVYSILAADAVSSQISSKDLTFAELQQIASKGQFV